MLTFFPSQHRIRHGAQHQADRLQTLIKPYLHDTAADGDDHTRNRRHAFAVRQRPVAILERRASLRRSQPRPLAARGKREDSVSETPFLTVKTTGETPV
ncbi:MAG: hypothetical protein JXQ75_19730, partial [Phycisphaerae bacterium]|nr:hypothetical protein [Phycisphaerae bacterium]